MNIRSLVHKDYDWTLFLDRDGVLNKRPGNGYVTHPSEFIWVPGSLSAVVRLKSIFKNIIVITNQQGIAKEVMNREDLFLIHEQMLQDVQTAGGRIDAIYFAEGLRHDDSFNRKPSQGMFLQAKNEFSELNPCKTIIAGDTFSDMMFGHRLGLHTVLISKSGLQNRRYQYIVDYQFNDLAGFAHYILNCKL
jgi:histidinol-phosphate phosphatase family protein